MLVFVVVVVVVGVVGAGGAVCESIVPISFSSFSSTFLLMYCLLS
jgi:hypothetical protein